MKTTAKKTLILVLAMVVVIGLMVGMTMLVKDKTMAASRMTVTSLEDLYDDDTRAKEDIAAMKEAGILDANGKMVDLDLRENGQRVELAALTTRIANGEEVGDITVNGKEATKEQVLKISQVSAALEIAELLDTEIDVTDEHVSNLEALLSGIQNGSIDLENTLKTGVLCLSPNTASATPVRGTGDEISQYATTRWNDLPTELTLTDDGKSFIGSYISGSTYEPEHAFSFESGLAEFVNGETGMSTKTNNVVTENNIRRDMFIWEQAIVGVDDEDRLNPVVTVVLPIKTDDVTQSQIASDADSDKLMDITENGIGVKMELPGYGEVNLRYIFRYMYFTNNDWHEIATGQYSYGNDPRYPVYLVESEVDGSTKVTAVATRFVAPANTGDNVRRDALSLCVNPRGSIVDDEYTNGGYGKEAWRFKGTSGHRLMPEEWNVSDWSKFYIDAKGYRYYDAKKTYQDEREIRQNRLWDALDAYNDDKISYEEYNTIYNECSNLESRFSITTAISGRCLAYYIAPAFLLSTDKYIERSDGNWESVEKGFIKLTNPVDPEFPYIYPKDTENPQNQYDVEVMYTEDLYQVYVNGYTRLGEDVDLRAAFRISDRQNFSIPAGVFNWDHYYWGIDLNKSEDGRYVTVVPYSTNTDDLQAQVTTGSGNITFNPGNFKIKDAAPYLLILKSSRIRETMTEMDTDISFLSNITEKNKISTVFKTELYKIREDQIDITATSIPEDAVKIEVPDWGDFPSPMYDPQTQSSYIVTHVTVPGTAMDTAGTYAFYISVEFSEGDGTQTLSAIAYLKVKQVPATVKLSKLGNAYVDKDHLPTITYSLQHAVENAEVKYTIQQAGSSAISEAVGSVAGGAISFPAVEFEGLKTAYTVTVYARNSAEDPWSVDSLLLSVYNNNVLKLLIRDVALGEFGGSTGGEEGNGTEKAEGTINIDNNPKVIELIDDSGEGSGYQISSYDFDQLRSDLGLQRVVSVNYGAGVWGAISDRMHWSYVESNGETSNDVTLNIKGEGPYTELRYYGFSSYVPTTDFLIVATGDKDENAPVTITATHAASGMTQSFNVTVNTLHNKLYLFRFLPKTTTYVTYTNGDGIARELHSNVNGELVVYEPSGIVSDVLTMSVVDGETYAGTYFNKDLLSGEKNVVKLEIYPCNNLVLAPISSQTLTILKPNGKPYSGEVTLRAGVYKGGEYCSYIGVRTTTDEGDQIVLNDIILNTNDGNVTLYYDPVQLTSDNGLTRGLKYVYEYRIDGYKPGYVIVDPMSSEPTESIVHLQSIKGSATSPQITRQEYQQYLNGTKPTSYVRNVIDSNDNIGISPNFPKAVLYTDIALPGETVGTDSNGYSTYTGADVVKFAFYTADGKFLTGQTDLLGDNVQATQITNLNQLDSATYFVFPFSAVPVLRSTYLMTNANMTADGITDEGNAPTSTARIKAVLTRGEMTVASMNMPFGVSNVTHLPDLSNKDNGAKEIGIEVKDNLKENADIGSIFNSINVNDMIRKGFVFLGGLSGAGADSPINLMILPTQDPATFRIIAFIGANQRGGDDKDGVSVNFNADDLAEDMNKFMEEMNKDDDDDDDDGEGSMSFNFYGTIILEAHAGVSDGKWDISFRGGNVGANVKGKYEWGQTFFCGPYPAFISFEVGFHADLDVAFGNKGAARAMLLDATLGVSVEAFAGLGFDLSIVAIQLGIYGQIGADVNFLMLTPNDGPVSTGTKLTISGEIGIKLKVKILFISYTQKFASTGFNWTKKWGKYDAIKNYWNDQGYGVLFGTTKSGRAYQMLLFEDGSAMVAIDGGPEMESRDYLELEERVWKSGARSGMRKAAGPITDLQTNAYPYSHPVFTDDGEIFLYVSDNDNANAVESVTSFAIKNGDGYENMGRVDVSEDNVLADLDVVASGTKDNAFAAWVKQVENPKKEKSDAVSSDDLGMMMNATEIYVGTYDGTDWTTTRLTDNYVADMSPAVASYGNKAIVAWRSMNASSVPAEPKTFDGKIYNGGSHTFSNEGDSYNLSTFDLSVHTNPILSFKVKCDYGDDWGQISVGHLKAQYSEDGGNTWIGIQGAEDLCYTDWGAWHDVSFALPAKNIQIRFVTSRFWMNNYNTVYIDNISLTADPFTEEPKDITAMFDVENNINYSIYNGSVWTTAKIAYNGAAGSVNAIDSAMLADGTAIITYTVRTGEDVTTTETFYTVVGADGTILTTGRLTNDSYTDTNAQATAVNEGEGYFVIGWYSEHDADVAHDIRLARINANGSYDVDFPESLGITSAVTSDFRFSAPVHNTDLTNVSIVWSQRMDSDEADDAGKYEVNAIRFYRTDSYNGFTAPTNICTTNKNYTIDHFDVYTDDEGAIHAIFLGTDYDSIKGIEVYDSIDLDAAASNTVSNNSDAPSNLDILDGEAISSLKLAKGTFPEVAADVTANINIKEVIPGFTTPVQFTVTNKGTDTITKVTATVGAESKDFTVNLLPNQTATLIMSYNVPEGAVSDVDYSVVSDYMELGSGTLILNRPDVGISGMKILREENGERDIQVTLSNSSSIPLAGSGKTVKLALYKDPFFESMIGTEFAISGDALADIDAGTYTTVRTINVSDLFTGIEIPASGLTVYARAWVVDTKEPNIYNNDSFVTFSGLLVRNNGEKLSIDTLLEVGDGSYTVYADIRNNSLQEVNAGVPVVVLLDSDGKIVASKNIQDTELVMTKESRRDLTVSFTADEIEGTPVEASVRFLYKVSFDVNGGSGEFADAITDLYGHIVIPDGEPTAPVNNPPVFFRGWYTSRTSGELVTEETFFGNRSTVYARYTPHAHVFECVVSDSGDTVTATCVSTVNDDCTLEDQGRTATLKMIVPERTATGYGMPEVKLIGDYVSLGSPVVYYYAANEDLTAKVGDALAAVPLNAGKYWAELTVGEGANAATIHVAYEIPVIEGLNSTEVTLPNYVRATDPYVLLNDIAPVDSIAALAWIYANEDALNSNITKYIVCGKRYMVRPDEVPEEYWPYEDGVEYALCYVYSPYNDCEMNAISVGEIIEQVSWGDAELYVPGTGSTQVPAEAEFNTVGTREELNGFNPSSKLDALLYILAHRAEISSGIVMLSQRDEYSYTFINFSYGNVRIMNGDLNYIFDMHEYESLPIYVVASSGSGVLNPNISYTVAFNTNGGNGNVSGSGRYYVKSHIEIPSDDGISKPNLVFDGWNTKADGTGDAYKAGDIFEVMANVTFYAQWKHVHNWTLTYNEDTHVHTATCSVPGCPNSTLTLQPKAVDKMYDGENATPYVCSAQWTEENGLPIPVVTYYVGGEEVLDAKNVGTYTALVSLNGHDDEVSEFSITKRPIIVIADDQEKHENQDDPDLTVSYESVGADLRFENDATYPWQIVTEGDRVYVKSGNAGQGNTTSTLTLTVTLAEEGTIYFDYKYGTENNWDWCYFRVDGSEKFKQSNVRDWTTYSIDLSAGTHTLTWAYSKDGGSDANGDFYAVDNVVIKSGGEVTTAEQENPNIAFNEALNVYEGGIVEGENLNYTISREEGETEGTYAITVVMGDNPNYDVREVRNNATFTILESLGDPQTIVADDVTATYGDTGLKIDAEITEGDGTLSYAIKNGDAVTVDEEGNLTIVKAGTAVITVTASQTETYAITTKDVTVTIDPKAMTASADDVNATVNGQSYGITVTVTDPANGYTVKYGTTEGTYNLNTCPTLSEAGTLTVYYQVTADNYVTFTGSAIITLVNHEHDLTYTVGTGEKANVITATCSNDDNCPFANNTATLTISAPEGEIVYNGNARPVIITDEYGIQGDVKVLYAVKGEGGIYGDASEAVPVNVGTYKASITLGAGNNAVTAVVEYEIKNAALTDVSVAQNGTLTYNGNAQTPEVTAVATAVNSQSVTFTYSLTENGEYGAMPTFTDVADAGTVYFKVSAPNHDEANGSFTVTMNKADRSAPAMPTLNVATANRIRLTEVEGCEYSMDGTTWQDSATFTGLTKNTEYTFYQRLKETANYNASPVSAEAKISTGNHDHEWGNFTADGATITAICGNTDGGHSDELSATITITAPTLTVYGGTGSGEATVINNIEGIDTPIIVYMQGDTVLDAAPTAAGTYTANITLNGATASVEYTIAKKAATVTAIDKSKTYGEDDPALTANVEGTVGTDTINYTLSRAEGENVDDYIITVTLGENPNYEVTATNAKLTINKKAASVTAIDKSKTYGDEEPTLTATVEGTVGNDTINYTLSRVEGENVGEYVITVTLGENPNYEVSATNAKLTINKKAATVTANDKSKTYGDEEPTLTTTVEGLVGDDAINYTLSRVEGENVGEYVITVTLGENPNYEVSATNAKLTINKKAASVTANDKSKTYGDEEPTLTVTVEGTVGTDTINYTLSRVEGENVGDYVITVTLGENPNYDVTATNAKLTINKKAASVTAADKSKTYGDEDSDLTATVEGTVGNDIINYTLSRAEGENVGDYAITVTLGENPNYEVTATNAKLTINKKAATVTAADKSKTYGDEDSDLTATVEGTVGTETINYTLSRAEGENVGEYVITVTLGENPNYDVTIIGTATYTIDQKAVTVTPDDKTVTYGDDVTLTYVATGLVGEETLTGVTLTRTEGNNVGTYTITAIHDDDLDGNYIVIITGTATYTINQKAVTVTPDDKTITYGDDELTLTYVATGLVGGETLTGITLTREEGTDAGAYTITATHDDTSDGNYAVTITGTATYTIKQKAVTVTPDDKTITYGDDDVALTYVATGLVGDEILMGVTVTREEGTNAGMYTITATHDDTSDGNYAVAIASTGVYTIQKKVNTIDTDSIVKEFTYNGSNFTVDGATALGDGEISYENNVVKEAGKFTVTVKVAEGTNYLAAETTIEVFVKETAPVKNDESGTNTHGKIISVENAQEGTSMTEIFKNAKEDTSESKEISATIDTAEIVFNEAAIEEISTAGEVELKFNVVYVETADDIEEDTLKDAEVIIRVSLSEGITFASGKATITFDLKKELPDKKICKVYYVDADGNRTDMNATFADGKVTFETNHFSDYIVVFEDKGLSGGAIAGIVIGCILGLLIIAFIILFILYKKDKGKDDGKKLIKIPFINKTMAKVDDFFTKVVGKAKSLFAKLFKKEDQATATAPEKKEETIISAASVEGEKKNVGFYRITKDEDGKCTYTLYYEEGDKLSKEMGVFESEDAAYRAIKHLREIAVSAKAENRVRSAGETIPAPKFVLDVDAKGVYRYSFIDEEGTVLMQSVSYLNEKRCLEDLKKTLNAVGTEKIVVENGELKEDVIDAVEETHVAETVEEVAATEIVEEDIEEPVEEVQEEVAESEEDAEEETEEPVGVSLKENIAVARSMVSHSAVNKQYVADYLKAKYDEGVRLNQRGNETKTGLPLADTHYAIGEEKNLCFVYVYEVEGTTMLLVKVGDEYGKALAEKHPIVKRSAFPKSKSPWYSVIVDDSFAPEEIEKILDDAYLMNGGKPAADEGLSLKESLAIAKATTVSIHRSKKGIADHLAEKYGATVELNQRVNQTKTGLPLADTHYVVKEDGKTCFVYVYETNGVVVLLLRLTEEYAKTVQEAGHKIIRSAFPKSKYAWYTVILDDTYTEDDIGALLDAAYDQAK